MTKKTTYLSIILVVLLIISSCSIFQKSNSNSEKPSKKKTEELEREKKLEKINEFITQMKSNKDIYWGEGIAPIEADLGQTKTLAKNRALKDLSEKIEVEVESKLNSILYESETAKGDKEYIVEKEELKRKIDTYTSQVLTNPQARDYIDYPRKGDLTYFTWINRSAYEEKVKKDIETKKMMITSAIQKGEDSFSNRRFLSAIKSWINAKNYLKNFFNNLPLNIKLEQGKNIEANSHIKSRIQEFFLNIRLSFLKENIYYDAAGNVSEGVKVVANYISPSRDKFPIKQFPLNCQFVEGEGEVISNLKTGNYGEAELTINYVEPVNLFSSIVVNIDTEKISGLAQFSLTNLPTAKLELKKTKTIAVIVYFDNINTVLKPQTIMNKVQAIFINNGLNTIELPISEDIMSEKTFLKASKSNADYLYSIIIKTKRVSSVGGYDMYKSICGGSASLYKLPQNNKVASYNIPDVDGYAVDKKGACWDALGNLEDDIIKKTKDVIEKIQ